MDNLKLSVGFGEWKCYGKLELSIMKEKKMNELQLYKQDDFLEFKKFESRNLSYAVFENIDFHKSIHLISFF